MTLNSTSRATGVGDDPETPRGGLAIELITQAVTSRAFAAINDEHERAHERKSAKWFELTKKGFIHLKITEEKLESTWFLVDRVDLQELPCLRP